MNLYYVININQINEQKDAINQSKKEVSSFINKAYNNDLKSSKSSIQEVVDEYSEDLSESQISLLIQLDEALKNSDNNIETIFDRFDSVKELALSELSNEEAQVVLAGVEIGKASILYWSENFDEWKEVLREGDVSVKGWFDWSEPGGADVGGAVGGAVTAAVVNAVPGAGQVAYGGAILGASAADAVTQVWNHYF